MNKDNFGNFLLWNDDLLFLYRVKQPKKSQYMLKQKNTSTVIYGKTITEVMENFKSQK